MAKVVWTAEAERWLLKIHDYIAADSPVNAFNVVKSIYQRAQILQILLWGHYRIVYSVRPNEEVHILGVFHGAMRFDEYLK